MRNSNQSLACFHGHLSPWPQSNEHLWDEVEGVLQSFGNTIVPSHPYYNFHYVSIGKDSPETLSETYWVISKKNISCDRSWFCIHSLLENVSNFLAIQCIFYSYLLVFTWLLFVLLVEKLCGVSMMSCSRKVYIVHTVRHYVTVSVKYNNYNFYVIS